MGDGQGSVHGIVPNVGYDEYISTDVSMQLAGVCVSFGRLFPKCETAVTWVSLTAWVV